MRAKGSLSGPSNVLDTVLNARHLQDVDAREYAFRMFATLKTPDTRFSEIVNPGLWVASGAWHGEGLIIEYVISQAALNRLPSAEVMTNLSSAYRVA